MSRILVSAALVRRALSFRVGTGLPRIAVLAWMTVCAASASAASWSGTYLAAGQDFSIYVQLVQSSGGVVVGRFKQVSIGKDSKLSTLDAPISGAGSGDQFVGKIEAPWHKGGVRSISARSLPGGGIQITGAGGLRENLQPATEEDEARAVERLTRGAQQALALEKLHESKARRQEIWRKRTEALKGIVNASSAYVEKDSLSFRTYASYPARYVTTTAKLEDLLAQVRVLTGATSEAIARRSTLTAAMLHAKIDGTEHPQIAVKHAYEDSMREWKRLDALLIAATKACQDTAPPDVETQAFQGDCARLPSLTDSLKAAGEKSKIEFYRIRTVYQLELAKQEALRTEAERR